MIYLIPMWQIKIDPNPDLHIAGNLPEVVAIIRIPPIEEASGALSICWVRNQQEADQGEEECDKKSFVRRHYCCWKRSREEELVGGG